MPKQLLFSQEARNSIQNGLAKLARAVKVTMGPTGRNVVLQKSYGAPRVTKDGVTVSKEIELPQPFENMGAKLVNEVASKTSDAVGDGTTTATLLAEAIYTEGLRHVVAGANPMDLKRGIDVAVAAVVQSIAEQAVKVKGRADIAKVGTIAANGDEEIGRILAEAIEEVGAEGVVEVEEGNSLETVKEVVEGMQFDKGYISPYFITEPASQECILEDAYILIFEKKVSAIRDVVALLEKLVTAGKPLLIIAEDVDGEALAALVVNKLRGVFRVCAVKAPGFGDRRKSLLGDIAVLTGGQLVSEDLGLKLENIELSHLGRAKKIVVNKDSTTLIEGTGKKGELKSRIAQLRTQLDQTTSDYDREKLQERLAKLTGGVAIIRVGGATEIDVKERKDLVDDAFHATRAAVEEGVVPGGGIALLRAIPALEKARQKARGDERIGVDIVLHAVEAPVRQIVENSGGDPGVVVEELLGRKGAQGYNACTGQYEDLVKAGVVDPAKVVRTSLQNAASVSGLLLTTEVLVTDLDEDKEVAEIAGAVR